MTNKQPATFDEWINKQNWQFLTLEMMQSYRMVWQASAASLKQRLLERMPEQEKILKQALKWCVENQFATHKDRGTSFQEGYNECREEILKIIEDL